MNTGDIAREQIRDRVRDADAFRRSRATRKASGTSAPPRGASSERVRGRAGVTVPPVASARPGRGRTGLA